MALNLFGKDTMPSLASMASDIADMAQTLRAVLLAVTPAPATKPLGAPLVVPISSTGVGQGQTWQTPDQINLTGLLIGGADSGRYILQVGGDVSRVFWLLAQQSVYFSFEGQSRWVISRGLAVTVVPPTAGHAWDAILTYYPADQLGRSS